MTETGTPAVTPHSEVRARILATAYELVTRRGVRDVGIDEIIEVSGVAKASLYRHFTSKTELVRACLAERDRRWTQELVHAGIRARAATAEQQLLAVFTVFDEWFQRSDFEGCSFINVMLEMGPQHPLGQDSIGYLADIRSLVHELARQAGLAAPDEFAASFHLLMKGSIVTAAEGDLDAARRAQALAQGLLAAHQPAAHTDDEALSDTARGRS